MCSCKSTHNTITTAQKMRDNVITPTLNTPTVITPTIITPTLNTDSLCNSGTFSNPNAVRDCPFSLKGTWFLSRNLNFFSYAALLFLKLFSAAQQKCFPQFHPSCTADISLTPEVYPYIST